VTKFANFLNTLISVPNNVAVTGANFQTWRLLAHTPNPTTSTTIVPTTPTATP
jgi:hypothetical protein